MRRGPLRILVLNHEYPPVGGGGSSVACEVARGYAAAGHRVTVVTMGHAGLSELEQDDHLTIHRVECGRRWRDRCTVPEMTRFLHAARRFLRRHLADRHYDVAHAHFIVPAGALALWLKRAYGLPYILTSHGSDVLGYNERFRFLYPLLTPLWRRIVAEARTVTAPSQYLARLIALHQSGLDVNIVPNLVDTRQFRAAAKENRILVVGRLIETKGIQDVLAALVSVDLNGWTVDIVGDGPYRRTLQERAADLDLSERVAFHGWLPRESDALKALYGRARVFVSASHKENMSMCLLEAKAALCFLVASNVGASAEIVGAQGLFEARDVSALGLTIASAMRKALVGDPPAIEDCFHSSRVVRRYEELCAS